MDKKYFEAADLGFESKRLYMRRFSESDLEDMFDYSSDPQVSVPTGFSPHKNLIDTKRKLDDFIYGNKELAFAITDKITGELLGEIVMMDDVRLPNKNVIEIGYLLKRECWGLGYMTECIKSALDFLFNRLSVSKVSAYHYLDNIKSKSVLQRCGFKYIETIKRKDKGPGNNISQEMFYMIIEEKYTMQNVPRGTFK